jgi:ATP-binding cassette subfamily B protein
MTLDRVCWPLARLGEGLEELARRAGLVVAAHAVLATPLAVPPAVLQGVPGELGRWIEWAAGRLGIDADAVEAPVPAAARLLQGAGPAMLRVASVDGPRFVALLGSRAGTLQLIGPDLALHRCPVELLRAALCAPYEAPLAHEIDGLMEVAAVPGQRRHKVRAAMLAERLGSERVGACWMLRLPAAAAWWRQLAQIRLPRRLALALALFVAVYGCEILGWGLIGNAALNGHADPGWLQAWLMLVLTIVPLRLAGGWVDAIMALDAGQLLKRRLLAGALRSDLETVKRQGAGQLLSRVMESQALEALAMNGGLSMLVAVVEFGFGAWLLASGAGGRFHLFLLALWLAVSVFISWRYVVRLRAWTGQRLDMTHELVERMVGHRTSLAQESPERRDAQQDGAMRDYLHGSRQMDKAAAPVSALVPGGWMLIGLLGLAPAFVDGSGSPVALAIGFGGVMLAGRAFSGLSGGLAALGRAALAWQNVSGLFRSAVDESRSAAFVPAAASEGGSVAGGAAGGTRLADASNVVFSYTPHGEPVLRGVDLSIARGERILLEGPSGGGKSTIASLLVGLHRPDSGLLLLHGLDRSTLGDSWHELATAAPQFHENHILSGTLGFNLLMGRNWPASEDELQEARDLCVELGLGELLERMPSGMMQMVGETGWQLSHGERSRIFLARALLQKAQLTILDESFAALDPETLDRCLHCALRRTQTLLVIAHP